MLSLLDQENVIHDLIHDQPARKASQGLGGRANVVDAGRTPVCKVPQTPRAAISSLVGPGMRDGGGPRTVGGVLRAARRGSGPSKGLETSSLCTPADSRIREPLGIKTTNAKFHSTPGPISTFKPSKTPKQLPGVRSSRVGNPRIHIHGTTDCKPFNNHGPGTDQLSEEPDVEHFPSKAVVLPPLPDFPDDDLLGPDREFPQLRPENMMSGWAAHFLNPVMEDGRTLSEKHRFEENASCVRLDKEKLSLACQKTCDEIDRTLIPHPRTDSTSHRQARQRSPGGQPLPARFSRPTTASACRAQKGSNLKTPSSHPTIAPRGSHRAAQRSPLAVLPSSQLKSGSSVLPASHRACVKQSCSGRLSRTQGLGAPTRPLPAGAARDHHLRVDSPATVDLDPSTLPDDHLGSFDFFEELMSQPDGFSDGAASLPWRIEIAQGTD